MEIICYLSNGYPTIEASYKIAHEYADAGCKMMEVDFPSRNPYLESDFLKARMGKALEACDDYDKYMESIIRLKKEFPEIKMLVLAYENTVLEIGTEKFINFCLENGIITQEQGLSIYMQIKQKIQLDLPFIAGITGLDVEVLKKMAQA